MSLKHNSTKSLQSTVILQDGENFEKVRILYTVKQKILCYTVFILYFAKDRNYDYSYRDAY